MHAQRKRIITLEETTFSTIDLETVCGSHIHIYKQGNKQFPLTFLSLFDFDALEAPFLFGSIPS
jgi:hypothetical protein